MFIVDDLGRQEEPPQALINRWIVSNGKRATTSSPFNPARSSRCLSTPLVVFSTNFHPNEIFDQAALRRIFFKVKIDGPTQSEFLKIFAMVRPQGRAWP